MDTTRRVARGRSIRACGAFVRACAAAAALLATAAPAQTTWRLDPDATRIHWEFSHFGTSTVRGRFDRLDGAVELDPERGRGEVSITVATDSVSTGLAIFDRVIRGRDVLDAERHPQAWFVARRIAFEGGVPVRLDGELTLKGISRPLTLRALHAACEGPPRRERRTCGGDYEAHLKRSDFGITYALPFAGDDVRLQVQVEAVAD